MEHPTTCPHCAQTNPATATSCSGCGHPFDDSAFVSTTTDLALWKQYLGPRAELYLARFRVFQSPAQDRFVLTWHWPAFWVGWLWYLYRKMYVHAAVFLIGGLLPVLLGAGIVGVIMWNIISATTAYFLYYMHIKLTLARIAQRAGPDRSMRDRLISDVGGIQPYVWWLGIGLVALSLWAQFSGVVDLPTPME